MQTSPFLGACALFGLQSKQLVRVQMWLTGFLFCELRVGSITGATSGVDYFKQG